MATEHRAPVVSAPTAVLMIVNAALFAIGALMHIGVAIGPIEEPASAPAMMLEVVATIVLGLATMGIFTSATWARRLASFANTFALVAVAAIAMLLGLDQERSAAELKFIQVIRVVLAATALLLLYQTGQRAQSGPP